MDTRQGVAAKKFKAILEQALQTYSLVGEAMETSCDQLGKGLSHKRKHCGGKLGVLAAQHTFYERYEAEATEVGQGLNEVDALANIHNPTHFFEIRVHGIEEPGNGSFDILSKKYLVLLALVKE